uniref:Uncharacterized protein n=1 Tax=Ananas comosus var. bracteatus TaxID=296719 RepID=A0A6V7P7G2_ANACO|nr:unnamed protein product [Ananas comosus var. bracteatus]
MSDGVHGVGTKKRTGGSKLQDLGAEANANPRTQGRRVADDADKVEPDIQSPDYMMLMDLSSQRRPHYHRISSPSGPYLILALLLFRPQIVVNFPFSSSHQVV